ncbi:hypothetical protein OX90_19695 [Pseudomonas coronafaciens pv. porri]|uniref:Uncharacterized protein n=1 Tax=Pseudomonas coronafaciens pv. porri TaxID=83964 RepID=A0ABR5JK53_9PSED|nr:hypothetical protein OX90_19695 [Pseudomonas coronafaciens pv. porri]KOP54682.1 hypothetical protein OX88_17305 [Pseudomonas coronafaciens pv. porri]
MGSFAFLGKTGRDDIVGRLPLKTRTDASYHSQAKQPTIQYAGCKKTFPDAPETALLANGALDALHFAGLLLRISP